MLIAIISAFLLCIANTIAAIMVFRRAFKKSYGNFSRIVLSSLVIRYIIMIMLVWAGLSLFGKNRLAFAMTVMIASFILLISEILYIHFKSNSLNLQNRKTK